MPDPQAPAVPSTTDLAALQPSVAITLLIVAAVSIVAFYVGPIARARFTQPRQPPPPPEAESTGAHALQAPQPSPAEQAKATTQQFIDHLLRQLEERDRRLAAKAREIQDLQQQAHRLETMLWQQQQQRGRFG